MQIEEADVLSEKHANDQLKPIPMSLASLRCYLRLIAICFGEGRNFLSLGVTKTLNITLVCFTHICKCFCFFNRKICASVAVALDFKQVQGTADA